MNQVTMSQVTPFPVRDPDVTHVIIEMFGGDNNLSPFVMEDMQEMAAGNRGPFAVLALIDYAGRGGAVVELSPRAGNHVIEELGEINTGDPETLASFLARALVTYGPETSALLSAGQHGTTFGGNPVATAAALATLHVLEKQQVLGHVRDVGEHLRAGLATVDGVTEVRGEGLLIGFDLDADVAPAVVTAIG